ncbi:MAG TPA: hypothetical protein VHU84_19315 [Lacipirellulaceae bacterium]|jgi:hypothetical protein|nr:hypothetical protein [Lacipirellulaceae bacterium]
MMASDPRFDVFPNEGQVPKQRSKWASCLIGCLAALGIVMVLLIGIGVWMMFHWRGFVADVGSQAIGQMVDTSDLPQQEKVEVKQQVDRIDKAFRDGKISMEQMGAIIQKVMDSPLMPSLIVAGVDKKYLDHSGLSNEEKAQGRIALNRFMSGAIAKKIDEKGIDAVMTHVADRQANGSWRLRQQVSDADLRAAIGEAKAQADTAGIAAEPPPFDPSDELKRIIDDSMPAGE